MTGDFNIYVGEYQTPGRWMLAIGRSESFGRWVEHHRSFHTTEQTAHEAGIAWINAYNKREERDRVSKELWDKIIDKYLETGIVP